MMARAAVTHFSCTGGSRMMERKCQVIWFRCPPLGSARSAVDAGGVRRRRIGQRVAALPRVTPWAVAAGRRVSGLQPVGAIRKATAAGLSPCWCSLWIWFFFWCWSAPASDRSFWLPAFYFLYLLTEAVFVYRAARGFGRGGGERDLLHRRAIAERIPTPAYRRGRGRAGVRVCGLQEAVGIAHGESGARSRRDQEEARRAREAERQRIASDFHDGPLQSFISLQMRLEILRKLLERDSGAGMDDLRDLQELAQQQVKELRAFVRSMRPPDMQGSNLYASARRICENFQKESGIPVSFVGGEGPLKFPEEMASEVIQMLREALHNVLKHAGATRVAVSLERVAKTLELSVDDNGGGFHFSGVYTLGRIGTAAPGAGQFSNGARAR